MTDPTSGITAARRAHSARCRQRVIKALNTAVNSGDEICISAIARMAAVDRTFLYRHPDLHALVIVKAAEPPVSADHRTCGQPRLFDRRSRGRARPHQPARPRKRPTARPTLRSARRTSVA